jgi:hypothetical protein
MVDEAAQFARAGYAVLPGLLGPDEVASVRATVDEHIAAPPGGACERPNNTLVPLRWRDPTVAAVLTTDRARRLATAVGAGDLRWISGYVSVKEAHSPPLWWHQDWWSWDHPASYLRPAVQVALLCYLCDTDSGNGALRVIPGSHLRSVPVHAALPEAHGEGTTALDPDHEAMRDQPGQVSLGLRAGDAAVLDYRLLHGTHANRSHLRRDCVLLNFAPSWATLPADIRAHLISHPALPGPDEGPPDRRELAGLIPTYDGPRRDLPLNRNAPASFAVTGS